ncbi:hydrogenase-4 component I [Methylocaldum marinum]|uniref:Hydrogenase-4 component I n=1 Tax=Methylocaldum marinum TaxID=1432792 RepID=A0A250KND2_9GAMM|nr:hydrogenase-4 component I [Methylocaldum marinum]
MNQKLKGKGTELSVRAAAKLKEPGKLISHRSGLHREERRDAKENPLPEPFSASSWM